jgi:hypothetical protein
MHLRLRLAPWFRAAFETLIALRDIGFTIEDADVDRLVESAVITEILSYGDN